MLIYGKPWWLSEVELPVPWWLSHKANLVAVSVQMRACHHLVVQVSGLPFVVLDKVHQRRRPGL